MQKGIKSTFVTPGKNYINMMLRQLIQIPITTIMMILGIGTGLLLFVLVVIGVIVGSIKEVFFYLVSSQNFTAKTTAFNPDTVKALITQE